MTTEALRVIKIGNQELAKIPPLFQCPGKGTVTFTEQIRSPCGTSNVPAIGTEARKVWNKERSPRGAPKDRSGRRCSVKSWEVVYLAFGYVVSFGGGCLGPSRGAGVG